MPNHSSQRIRTKKNTIIINGNLNSKRNRRRCKSISDNSECISEPEFISSNIVENTSTQIIAINNDNTSTSDYKSNLFSNTISIHAALINDRHNMPVNDGIFELNIPTNKLFDYEWYEHIIHNWILHKVPKNENNLWSKTLSIYITGLPAATAALIKVCNNMKINLCLMHYNYEIKSYEKQVIFDDFPISSS